MTIWQWLGAALLVWLVWDLVKDHTWIHRQVERRREPGLYWGLMAIWAAIALVLVAGLWG